MDHGWQWWLRRVNGYGYSMGMLRLVDDDNAGHQWLVVVDDSQTVD